MMRSRLLAGLLGCVGAWLVAGQAKALVAAVAPGPGQLVQADAVVVGRVVALEPQDVEVPVAPGRTTPYRIAVVQVSETLRGMKGDVKMVRVGFRVPTTPNVPAPAGGGFAIRQLGRVGGVRLEPGQHGLFLLNRHPQGDFYTLPRYGTFINSVNNKDFAADVAAVRKLMRLADNAPAALKSDDAEDRFLAAAILVGKYRSATPGKGAVRQEPIDAEESKLILKALAEADWQDRPGIKLLPYPQQVFNRLGLTKADGWVYPRGARNPDEVTRAMREWLRENAERYRVRRMTREGALK